MAWENWTTVTEFIFKGLTDHPGFQGTLLTVFLVIYVTTVVGNLGILIVVWLDSHLQIPMYFFLSNLSFLDVCYSSAVTPKVLVNYSLERKTTSFAGCLIQLYFYAAFATTECYLLAVMAYDRDVAICIALHSHVVAFFNPLILTGSALRMSFCGPNFIDHFFCDGCPLLKLACSGPHLSQVLMLVSGGFSEVSTTSVVLISNCCIRATILRMDSTKGRYKAINTCASHLTAVAIFCGTLLFMYLRPSSSYSLGRDKIISVFYVVVTPMLNPLIYSLRNKEVKNALKRA
ncbi:olfactory receptor 5AP2-like [Dromaius novaehollandiae]|uniref:olfactory receptor 5AP2-like n=1 Tax=Dromaius novaehollandiae TaxID=8790 RepID=UPI00311DDEC7